MIHRFPFVKVQVATAFGSLLYSSWSMSLCADTDYRTGKGPVERP